MFSLPDNIFTWLWTPHFERLQQEREGGFERSPGGLWLPSTSLPDASTGAIVYFSILTERCPLRWLWLFETEEQARCVRLLPEQPGLEDDEEAQFIASTLPRSPDSSNPYTELQIYPAKLVANNLGAWRDKIQRVWLGFDLRRFARTRSLADCVTEMETDEFLKIARR